MLHPNLITALKRHPMINRVSWRIILRKEKKSKIGNIPVCFQAFVNHQRLVIPLSIRIEAKYFDTVRQRIKKQHPMANSINLIISNAETRATQILAEANEKNFRLDRENFRARFTLTQSDYDFVSWWEKELEQRKPLLNHSSYKQQQSSLRKFKRFRKTLPFDKIDDYLPEDYERWLRQQGNNINTIGCAHKNLKVYIGIAIRKGLPIRNPYKTYKIKRGAGRPTFLTIAEQKLLLQAYQNKTLPPVLNISLLVFLCQCYTSLRISDIKDITPAWLSDKTLRFMPRKTASYQKTVSFNLPVIALQLLQQLFEYKQTHRVKAEQKINLDLKLIAAHLGIHKNLTTHVARHTFATTFLTLGGQVDVLQEIMGHSSITTTMIYVKIIDERKTQQMENFDNEFQLHTNVV